MSDTAGTCRPELYRSLMYCNVNTLFVSTVIAYEELKRFFDTNLWITAFCLPLYSPSTMLLLSIVNSLRMWRSDCKNPSLKYCGYFLCAFSPCDDALLLTFSLILFPSAHLSLSFVCTCSCPFLFNVSTCFLFTRKQFQAARGKKMFGAKFAVGVFVSLVMIVIFSNVLLIRAPHGSLYSKKTKKQTKNICSTSMSD